MVSIHVDSAEANRSLVPAREVRAIAGHALETRLWASPEWRAGSALAGLVATFFMAFVVMAGLGVAFQADHRRPLRTLTVHLHASITKTGSLPDQFSGLRHREFVEETDM